ncbi:MAG: hypothetical protein LBV27_10655, partial [Oscillospiraceae bacterium]|nr:hypothetical protein [Oscillospiraceae bacterium]
EFYNFQGDRDTFASTGTLQIPITRSKFTPKKSNSAQVFAYEIVGDRLTALDERSVSFDGKKNILSLKTRTLGNYVLSSTALLKDVDDETENILYTGYATSSTDSADESSQTSAASTTPTGTGTQQSASAGQTSYINDNVNTGLAINAANVSADNPLTGDSFAPQVTTLLIVSAGVSALLVLTGKKSRRPRANKNAR